MSYSLMSSSDPHNPRRRAREEGDDDDDGDNNDNDEIRLNKVAKKKKKLKKKDRLKKKRKKLGAASAPGGGWIDDAAELSGEEDDDDEDDDDEDDDEGNNDYVKDGFVVDEEDDEEIKKKKDDLEDSEDDDDDEDDDEGIAGPEASARKRLKKVRKMRATERLDEEDLALIQEAQQADLPVRAAEPVERERLVAKSEAELRKSLFHDSEDEGEDLKRQQLQQQDQAKDQLPPKKQVRVVERYDEDGMDDFIDDDIGDQGEIMASERRGGYGDDYEDTNEINEAQLNEASEIFGTDYLDFMANDEDDELQRDDEEALMGKKYRERGVGVDYGVEDSDVDIISDDDEDDDDDLFGEADDDDDAGTSSQKAEALRLKREKRKLAKAERRRQALLKKSEKRKAQLRRAFEPVQLVENFCTEKDDEIRLMDAPERFYDWTVPFHGPETATTTAVTYDKMSDEEKAEAMWISGRIPDIASEFYSAPEEGKKLILQSIGCALRFLHRDKLEPAFIKRYRKDDVSSRAVRENLYRIMEQDGEYDRILGARSKVKSLLKDMTKASEVDESSDADAQTLVKLKQELKEAQEKLDETAKQESIVKAELDALGAVDDDDDDDNLFGDDGGDKDGVRKNILGFLLCLLRLLSDNDGSPIELL